MNAKEFFVKVSRMRDAQKMYFKYRSDERLQEAFRLQEEVDKEILRTMMSLSQQELNEMFSDEKDIHTNRQDDNLQGVYPRRPSASR